MSNQYAGTGGPIPPQRPSRTGLYVALGVLGVLAVGFVLVAVAVGAVFLLRSDSADKTVSVGSEVARPTEEVDRGCAEPDDVPEAEGKPEVEVPEGEVPSDLVITDLTTGTGDEATLGTTVTVHYVGIACSTGRQFDASWDRGEPTTFALERGRLIDGWIEGLEGMRAGGRRLLVIPPDLAYGEDGQGDIAPDETLVFVIDLIAVDGDGDGTAGPVPSPVALPPPPAGTTIDGPTPCPPEDGAPERASTFAQAPPECIDPGQPLEAVIETTVGRITVALDVEGAPTMVNNFVVLARYRYFDGLPFHRLVPDFVVQGGSSGIPDYGSGGPGYDLPDVEKPDDGYRVGDVAMARAQEVSGSQFFIVASEDGAAQLTNDYPLFGRVTSGLDLIADLAAKGDPATNGGPTEMVTITSVTIRPTR